MPSLHQDRGDEARLNGETSDQLIVAAVLAATLVLFAWARWRYDVVALIALLSLVLLDIIPASDAFTGFGHPAVITVAGVLMLSRGLQNSGVIDYVARWLSKAGERPTAQVAATSGFVAVCSAFMNNVGALALLLPATIRLARRAGNPRSLLLMPLAFASLLGGMMTVVGTPPNIIIANFRAGVAGEPFAMFDFTPVGFVIMVTGITFLSLFGWRLIARRPDGEDDENLFDIHGYLTELRVIEDSSLVGRTLGELEAEAEASMAVVAIVRREQWLRAPSLFERLAAGDVLVVEADAETIEALVAEAGLEPVGSSTIEGMELDSDEIRVVEAVVMARAPIEGRSVHDLRLRRQHGVNLLAIARQGGRIRERLSRVRLRPGDVLLLQGPSDHMAAALASIGCLPLAERGIELRERGGVLAAVLIFGGALFAAAGLRIVPIEIAVLLAAVAMGFTGLVTLRQAYEAIDWPVLVLLGAMIPVGASLESTGAAAQIADWFVQIGADLPVWMVLVGLLVIAMLLSDVVNNAAAAVLLAPIAISTADGLGASTDPFLMAVAIGASSAFLTPIGHQSNILVMGPGGYRFADYWRVGLPLEVLIVAVSVPMLMVVWPP